MLLFFFKTKKDLIMFFFFSSRRRHTRCGRDWSSEVCSSDLPARIWPICCWLKPWDAKRRLRFEWLLAQGEAGSFDKCSLKAWRLRDWDASAGCYSRTGELIYSSALFRRTPFRPHACKGLESALQYCYLHLACRCSRESLLDFHRRCEPLALKSAGLSKRVAALAPAAGQQGDCAVAW